MSLATPNPVLLVTGALSLVMPPACWVALGRPRQGGPLAWTLGYVVAGLGMVLTGIAMREDSLPALWLGRCVIFVGLLLIAQSFRIEMGRPWAGPRLAALGALQALALGGVALAWPGWLGRAGMVGTLLAVLTLAGVSWRAAHGEPSRNARRLAGCYWSGAAAIAVTTLDVWWMRDGTGLRPVPPVAAALRLAVVLASVAFYFGLANERAGRRKLALLQEMRQAERLQARRSLLVRHARERVFGVLAAAIAAQVAQPIRASVAALRGAREKAGGTDAGAVLPLLADAGERICEAAQVLERLRAFVRQLPQPPAPVHVGRLAEDVCHLVESGGLREGVVLRLQPVQEDLWMEVDQLALSQALLQLIRRAAEQAATRAEAVVTVAVGLAAGMLEIAVAPAPAETAPPLVVAALVEALGGDLAVVAGGVGEARVLLRLRSAPGAAA